MSEKTCPQCGKKAGGSFCSWCGAALAARYCNECGSEVEPGARFCNRCGTSLAGGTPATGTAGRGGGAGAPRGSGGADTAGGGGQLAWWVAGGALVALILIIAYPVIRQSDVAPDGSMAPAAGGSSADAAAGQGAPAVDITSMTPRQAADQLFNRVMRAAEAGDSAQVAGFLPMSIQAYDRARPLDADGLFHLSLLQQTGGQYEEALATAREALEENPNHLLNLGAAARAAHLMGDDETARSYYQQLVDVWDEEMARELQEYQDHSLTLPGLRQEAVEFLGR